MLHPACYDTACGLSPSTLLRAGFDRLSTRLSTLVLGDTATSAEALGTYHNPPQMVAFPRCVGYTW